eukprot:gnl/TRDRNA2_/TRDRNA2_172266_c1_seq1.p1 gnl/TRDRNA2_/TRDRNA2_172266_c1~~gnl/TRDRNA2_/TRDRNA2_172266_c1_seq1.p1  ORF type:complete len:400 (-),score=71.77 gnl/TRDRNA2_/TRDRNA2_172266_c1_seq1:922-2034(-)
MSALGAMYSTFLLMASYIFLIAADTISCQGERCEADIPSDEFALIQSKLHRPRYRREARGKIWSPVQDPKTWSPLQDPDEEVPIVAAEVVEPELEHLQETAAVAADRVRSALQQGSQPNFGQEGQLVQATADDGSSESDATMSLLVEAQRARRASQAAGAALAHAAGSAPAAAASGPGGSVAASFTNGNGFGVGGSGDYGTEGNSGGGGGMSMPVAVMKSAAVAIPPWPSFGNKKMEDGAFAKAAREFGRDQEAQGAKATKSLTRGIGGAGANAEQTAEKYELKMAKRVDKFMTHFKRGTRVLTGGLDALRNLIDKMTGKLQDNMENGVDAVGGAMVGTAAGSTEAGESIAKLPQELGKTVNSAIKEAVF